MSLGLGVLLSVLALILAWQIDKRGAWRTIGRFTIGVVTLAFVGGFILFAWLQYGRWTNARQQLAQRDRVRRGEFREYQGVPLGAPKNDVLYRKGEPTERKDDTWTYKYPNQVEVIVQWSSDGTVEGVACHSERSWGCDEIGGVEIGTTEESLRSLLGEPSREFAPDEQGIKVLNYGTRQRYASYWHALAFG